MPATLECILHRAFNTSEYFYQYSPLSRLYQAPDWESFPVYDDNHMTPLERIQRDSQNLIQLKRHLSKKDFSMLELIYCQSLGVNEWRSNLKRMSSLIQNAVRPIRFNHKLYEYICISHLTGHRIKQLYFTNSTVRRNRRKICNALDNISKRSHNLAGQVLNHEGD